MCIGAYADVISSMTIHLMQNTERGDIRVRNELAKKLDISPNRYMTRKTFMEVIVRALLAEGNQITLPVYKRGYLDELRPAPPSMVSLSPDGDGYSVRIGGVSFSPDELLHFVIRPDPEEPWRGRGFSVELSDVVKSLRQAGETKRAILKSPAPSIIVKVDGLTEEFKSSEGRRKLRAQYLDSSESGEPWFIPAEAFAVEQVKPLTINDLAIAKNLELDKRSVAAMMGVPPFMVGVGDFKRDEFNWWVSTRVMSIAMGIQQELTSKLLYAPDLYFRLNNRSLLNYDVSEIVSAGSQMVDRMSLRRNEWRDWLGFPPDVEMDELLALENYLPADRLGDQKKLMGGDNDANGEADKDSPDAISDS